jgi:hypothetical protein
MARAVVVRLFDEVGIVAASFDDAGVGAVSSVFGASFVDFGERVDQCCGSVFRGKSPPAL